jgi:RNA polymerase sigma factor (TIGR02999 family)
MTHRVNLVYVGSPDITGLLRKWSQGDRGAAEELTPVIYSELRSLAKRFLRMERSDHSLQSAELVHEAYLRLVGQGRTHWKDRSHFFAICAGMMRRILVDHARSKHRVKRGGGATTIALSEAIDAATAPPFDVIALDTALDTLAKMDAQQCRVVELRFFAGLSIDETAEALQVSKSTVNRDWVAARAWLMREFGRVNQGPPVSP